MDSEDEEYAKFIEKVRRTIYVDNISAKVTESIMKAAFSQFGNVIRVQFIPTFMQPQGAPRAVLVEMETRKQAEQIISEMNSCPFMIAGMPRPVMAKTARVEMFDDRPRKPGRKIKCRWLHPKEPCFGTANKIKNLVKRHAEESSFLLERQVEEEENLEKQQRKILEAHCKKLKLLDDVFIDGTVKQLARHYSIDAEGI